MGRGQSPRRSGAVSRRRAFIATRVTAIAEDYDLLKQGMTRYPDVESFAGDWSERRTFEAGEHIAALERWYENIINSLNQIIDTTEHALVERDAIGDPTKPGGPGRWQRLQIYGVIEQAEVKRWQDLAERRNIFQKKYPELDADAAADIYDDTHEFMRRIARLLKPLQAWVDRVAP